jgi:hypothetical protein
MPSPSQRIAKAAAESAEASRRLAAAEAKIASTFMEMIRDDDAENTATPPPLPKQGATPSKNQPPKK